MNEIATDSVVTIYAQRIARTGIVRRAINYGTDESSNWYIEMNDLNGEPVYWKQAIDGEVGLSDIGRLLNWLRASRC